MLTFSPNFSVQVDKFLKIFDRNTLFLFLPWFISNFQSCMMRKTPRRRRRRRRKKKRRTTMRRRMMNLKMRRILMRRRTRMRMMAASTYNAFSSFSNLVKAVWTAPCPLQGTFKLSYVQSYSHYLPKWRRMPPSRRNCLPTEVSKFPNDSADLFLAKESMCFRSAPVTVEFVPEPITSLPLESTIQIRVKNN